ncbi:MAG: Crp/Fnr family transcriptional regulator [Kiloniellaceae bacterium]
MFCPLKHSRPDCSHCVVRHISLCSQVDGDSLAELQAMAKRGRFDKGRVVFEQDARLGHVFLITRGLVKLYRDMASGKRQITGFLGPGDLLGGVKRRAGAHCTAETITEIDVCAFERDRFSWFLQCHPGLCFTLLVTAMDEIEAQYDHLILLGRKLAPERLAAFLLMLSTRWKLEHEDRRLVHTIMPRGDMADHLGLTSETISRTFSRFKEEGLIEVPNTRSVILKNIPTLQDLAGFEELPSHRMAIGL